jgi:hypothetical protein
MIGAGCSRLVQPHGPFKKSILIIRAADKHKQMTNNVVN